MCVCGDLHKNSIRVLRLVGTCITRSKNTQRQSEYTNNASIKNSRHVVEFETRKCLIGTGRAQAALARWETDWQCGASGC